jgi:hypothetical protein
MSSAMPLVETGRGVVQLAIDLLSAARRQSHIAVREFASRGSANGSAGENLAHVRFTFESGHWIAGAGRPLSAIRRRGSVIV